MRRALAFHGLLLLVSAIWGGHFVALRYLLQELAPGGVMLVRGLLASAFYVVFLLLSRPQLPAIERAYLLLGQALTRRQAGGVALAMAGLLVVMLFGAPGARFSVANVLGVLLMSCAPLTWAFYTVLSKPLLGRYPSAFVAAYGTM